MTRAELAECLKEMYTSAKEKEQVLNIHLFGIKYGEHILKNKYKVKDIILAAGLNPSYATEVSKAVNLSKYVEMKK